MKLQSQNFGQGNVNALVIIWTIEMWQRLQNLRDPVNAFMEDLTPETPQWRANFGVTDIPYLFQV